VTVLTQPTGPSQTCNVTAGSGTVTSGPVTVNVACTVNTYAVSAVVTGLAAGTTGALVLRNNGGDDLSISANGTFPFATPVASGAAYAVTVLTQPSGPNQTCTVTAGSGTVAAAPVSVSVSCAVSVVLQKWQAPTVAATGVDGPSFWSDVDPLLVQHTTFDATGPLESKLLPGSWSQVGTVTAPLSFDGFWQGLRYGSGTMQNGRYQWTGDGDQALDALTHDMLVCAVFKPDRNPVSDGDERVIAAKGIQGMGGWVLMQMHEAFCFHYQHLGLERMAFIPTGFAPGTTAWDGPTNISYVVLCGGRSGDDIVVAANSYPDAHLATALGTVGDPMDVGSFPLTLGGYSDGSANHVFGGRVYELAVWNEPATEANIQAKFAAVQGLSLATPAGAEAQYSRPREAFYVHADAPTLRAHATWQHGPRVDLNQPPASSRGFLFGLQAPNRVTRPENVLGTWTASAGAAGDSGWFTPPSDSEQFLADQLTLAPGASFSLPLANFTAPGAVHGQLWVMRANSSAGTLRVRTTDGLGTTTTGQQEVNVGAQTNETWQRIWLTGAGTNGIPFTTDGAAAPAAAGTIYLEAPVTNAGTLTFSAWGVELAQLATEPGAGAVSPFPADPGPSMYDWSDIQASDSLKFPPVAESTASTGFCLAVEASPATGLPWATGAIQGRRMLALWRNAAETSFMHFFVEGGSGNLCLGVNGVVTCGAAPPAWTAGSKHTVAGCITPAGVVRVFGDGNTVATATLPGAPPAVPDLQGGQVVFSDDRNNAPWQGYISKALVCRSDSGFVPTDCH
jgi:hypothetical protein